MRNERDGDGDGIDGERGLRKSRRSPFFSLLFLFHSQAKKAALTPKKKLGRPPKAASSAKAAGLKKGNKAKPGPKPKNK